MNKVLVEENENFDKIEELVENDEISLEEEGFMRGFDNAYDDDWEME